MKNYEYILTTHKKFLKRGNPPTRNLLPNEIMVNPKFVGVCGSDLYHYTLTQLKELHMGHEWIGEVVAIGSEVKNLKTKDVVTTSATIGCGKCEYCLNLNVNLCSEPIHLGSDEIGCLRSEIILNSFNALKLKSDSSSEVLIEVMAVAEEAWKIIQKHKKNKIENVLILGAGTVGILLAFILKQENIPTIIVDIAKNRIENAKRLDLNSQMLNQLIFTHGNRGIFDVIVDATSDRDGNSGGWNYLTLFGKKKFLALMIGKYTRKIEITPDLFSRLAANLVFMRGVPLDTLQFTINKWSGKLDSIADAIISHKFYSYDLNQAFAVANNTSISGKVIIEME